MIPWRKTWVSGLPCSYATGKEYRGINIILLGLREHTSRYWISYKQASKLKGFVKRGEKGMPVVYWHWRDEEEKRKLIAIGKTSDPAPCTAFLFKVFNLEQTEGLKAREDDLQVSRKEKLAEVEKILSEFSSAPEIQHALQVTPCYYPTVDVIHMPYLSQFESANHYYSTLFHELIHSTGHASRLNRELRDAYSFEELVAEIGAAFLCAVCGIENVKTIEDQAAYIAHWQAFLEDDSTAFMRACSEAQKAVDYIRNVRFETEEQAA